MMETSQDRSNKIGQEGKLSRFQATFKASMPSSSFWVMQVWGSSQVKSDSRY